MLDATDARALAEFYRELLGYAYRPGDEAPPAGEDDPKGTDFVVLVDPWGRPASPSSRWRSCLARRGRAPRRRSRRTWT